ncbi:MAG: choice-of-anchor J domain-containing protein [Muribaculaceae bacterium]|nr:choice-of-anchor J domain-containing protein [Muribaculaceae bacterium]
MNNHTRIVAIAAAVLTAGAVSGGNLPGFTSVDGPIVGTTSVAPADPVRAVPEMGAAKPSWLSLAGKEMSRSERSRVKASVAAPAGVGYYDSGDKVALSWNGVAGASEYRVYEAGATSADIKVLGTTSATSFDIMRDTDSGDEAITLFGVTAVVDGSESQISASPVLTTGRIAPLPWMESFRNGNTDKFFWTERSSDQQWGLLTDASGLPSMDGDNGIFAFMAISTGDYINLHTGKIALTGNPYLVFTRYYRPTQDVELTVVASFPDGTSAQVFKSVNNGTAAAYWKSETVDMSAYKDYRYCTLSFNYLSKADFPNGGALVALDGLKVIDNKKVDVAAELVLPSKVMKGQKIAGDMVIQNNSLSNTPAINVKVAVNGTPVIDGTLQGVLGALGRGLLAVEVPTSSLMQADVMEVTAEVTVAGDEVPENDRAAMTVALEQTWRNPVAALQAFRTPENGISLEWSAPAHNSKAVEDGFEDYEPWATEFGEWTTIDNDLAFHGGVFPVSDYPGQFELFAFKIMTPEEIGEENNSNSGRSYLGGPFGVLDDPDEGATYAASDAWLISPELSGEAHTGSFYAASTPAYNAWWEKYDQTDETFYIMYSTTGNDAADFNDYCYAGSISHKQVVDDEHYVKVEFAIPEGARYFAIHHTTPAGDGCMLRLDDFSYIAGGTPASYNVYADGALLSSVSGMSCLDADLSAAKYEVTAVYRDGSESLPVDVLADQASLAVATADGAASPFDIYNLQGVAVRRGAASVESAGLAPGIYVAKGKKIVIR